MTTTGRPRRREDLSRANLPLRCTKTERAAWHAAAKRQSTTLAAVMRRALNGMAGIDPLGRGRP